MRSLRKGWQIRWVTAGRWVRTTLLGLGALAVAAVATGAPADFDASFGSGTGRVSIAPLTAFQSDSIPSATMLLPDGRIMMAGRCVDMTAGRVQKVCLTRHLANGERDPSLNGSGTAQFALPVVAGEQTVESPRAIRTSDGKVVVAFRVFHQASSTIVATLFVRLTSFGALDGPFGPLSSPGFARLNGIDVYDMAPLPDGRFVAMGICAALSDRRCIARVELDGTLDTTFGNHNGFATSPLVGDQPSGALGSIAVLANGKIVLGVPCLGGPRLLCVLGFSANGIADAPRNGWYMTFGSSSLHQVSMVVQPDGKLLFAGQCGLPPNAVLCLARMFEPNPNAASSSEGPDTSFSGDGQLLSVFLGYDVNGVRVTLDGNGRIVVAAECNNIATQLRSLCVFRFNSDGSTDSSFGNGGRSLRQIDVAPDTSTLEQPHDVVVQSDARILIGAGCSRIDRGDSAVYCMARLLGDTSLPQCSLDIDGDGTISRGVDALLHARAAAGMTTGSAMSGITFPPSATRSQWSDIIGFLVNSCGLPTGTVPAGQCSPDIDGDGKVTLGIDSLILMRVTAGLTQAAALGGINFPAAASRKNWTDIRNFLVNQCGMTIAP